MNRFEEIVLKGLRKTYQKFFHPQRELPPCETDPDKASDMIYQLLVSDKPCMIARFGSTELSCLSNYIGIIDKSNSSWKYITGQTEQWWWNQNIVNQMREWSGFFPANEEYLTKFCELMLSDIQQVDVLGSWIPGEVQFNCYFQDVKKVKLMLLEPFWSKRPWTDALEEKKVVVVHPFAEQIGSQYQNKREQLFTNCRILPDFSLRTVKAVQSLGGESEHFKDWFDALEYMKAEIDKLEYDIALIGCGAYGFPLAAHVKRTGHKAVHLGGALQLLFGIRGKRWENPYYGVREWGVPYGFYLNMMNNNWLRPSDQTKPKNAQQVEDSCYW